MDCLSDLTLERSRPMVGKVMPDNLFVSSNALERRW